MSAVYAWTRGEPTSEQSTHTPRKKKTTPRHAPSVVNSRRNERAKRFMWRNVACLAHTCDAGLREICICQKGRQIAFSGYRLQLLELAPPRIHHGRSHRWRNARLDTKLDGGAGPSKFSVNGCGSPHFSVFGASRRWRLPADDQHDPAHRNVSLKPKLSIDTLHHLQPPPPPHSSL